KKIDLKIVNIAKRKQNITSSDISNVLKKKGVNIDPSTVRRRLRESGGTYGPPLKKTVTHRQTSRATTHLGSTTSTLQLGQRDLYR
ncbi:unnamed protein product, partial [Rotaria sordida]